MFISEIWDCSDIYIYIIYIYIYSTAWKFVNPLQNLWKCNFNKIREII